MPTDDGDILPFVTPRAPPPGLQSAMIDEVFAQATEEQALNFFVAVGARIAARHTLPDSDAIGSLEHGINAVWQALGLGQATLAMADDGITVEHRGYGPGESAASRLWPRAAAALLRGAYGAWFGSIGGQTLHTRLVRQTAEQITLHHGL